MANPQALQQTTPVHGCFSWRESCQTDSTPGFWINKCQISFCWGGSCCKCTFWGGGSAGFCLGIACCVPCATLSSTNLSLFQASQTHINHVLQFLLNPTKKNLHPPFFPLLYLGVFTPKKRGVKFTPQKRGVWADRGGVHVRPPAARPGGCPSWPR